MRTKVLFSVLVLFSLLASCNMPTAGQPPVTQPPQNQPVSADPNAIATAVELTAVARVTEIAGSVVPATAVPATATLTTVPATATSTTAPVVSGPCSPTVTATVNANVRSGPDTAYDIIGALTLGQTATIVGRNDAYTWWYIDYPGVAGSHGWIAGTVVTSACVPSVVQVVAAPDLPTPTEVVADNSGGNPLVPLQPLNPNVLSAFRPDLTVINLDAPTSALAGSSQTLNVKVKNIGNTDAGSFTVQVWDNSNAACSWAVPSLAVGASKNLNCSYAFAGAGEHAVKAVVDAGAAIKEANENNNTSQETVQVSSLFIKPKVTLVPIWP